MKFNKYCFKFNSYDQIKNILNYSKEKNIVPILFCNYHLINGLGSDWLVEIKKNIEKDYKGIKFKFLVDVKKNYGLFIDLVEKKISYLKVNANDIMLKKLTEIAKSNKVLINPNFSIVDLNKNKNINKN